MDQSKEDKRAFFASLHALKLRWKEGTFGEILDVLTNAGVNIDATYTCLPKEKDRAYLVLKVKDTEGAEACLRAAGVEIVTSEKLAELFGE